MESVDQVLDTLIRDVEASVHAFYRGEVRRNTQRVKTNTFRNAAKQALLPLIGGGVSATPSAFVSAAAGAPLTPDEIVAAQRCVIAWLPMGSPAAANPQSRCVAAAREILPSWGEREKARLSLKRAAG